MFGILYNNKTCHALMLLAVAEVIVHVVTAHASAGTNIKNILAKNQHQN